MRKHPVIVAMLAVGLLGAVALTVPSAQSARRGTENGEWRTLGGDIGHTRYSPLDQITPANFETLKEAWKFSPIDVVGPMTARATPSYVGGKLLSVAGPRRHVVSIDPTSGKLLWNWVEPETYRSKYSMRTAYGKGVAYSRDQRQGCRLHRNARFLPRRVGRRHRQAASKLGPSGWPARLPRARASSTWLKT